MRFRFAIFFLLVAFAPSLADAQTIRLQFSDTTVSEALTVYSAETGVDVVYGPLLVADLRTSCRYRGTSERDALICIMSGHPFRVESISRRQAVLIPLDRDDQTSAVARKQVLSGFVLDAESGEVLHGAHVVLPGVGSGTTTNEAGYFAFPGLRDRPLSLAVTYLGFSRLDTTVTASTTPGRFALHPVTFQV
ncbi:MAG: carboxypeptidase-like regulatory domain-containing protein, partial [Bacteroidota bacterium]|nr:carboxypeptidase-like regulatory domain-containing protein [Bacteroidota bacterium]